MSSRSKQQRTFDIEDDDLDDDDEVGDPYNSRTSPTGYGQEHTGQLVYDSMSTILEVDSEESSSNASLDHQRSAKQQHLSPLHVRTTTPESASSRNQSSFSSSGKNHEDDGSPISGLSPTGKFSGTLSALSQQIEMLKRRSSITDLDGERSSSRSSRGDPATSSSRTIDIPRQMQQHDASTSPIMQTTQDPEESGSKSTGEIQRSLTPLKQQSRAPSAESLMMITVSPMPSPRIKFPITRNVKSSIKRSSLENLQGGDLYEPQGSAKVVEVSNKSTITKIDLELMDKMIEKYFVETSDKSTQSIKFDCDDGDTIELDKQGNMKRKSSGSELSSRKPAVKSIAVGTETFSRERFSLLPSTKTRSTQTKPNLSDNDKGISETRRYKLNHLDLSQSIKAKSNGDKPSPQLEQPQERPKSPTKSSIESPESFEPKRIEQLPASRTEKELSRKPEVAQKDAERKSEEVERPPVVVAAEKSILKVRTPEPPDSLNGSVEAAKSPAKLSPERTLDGRSEPHKPAKMVMMNDASESLDNIDSSSQASESSSGKSVQEEGGGGSSKKPELGDKQLSLNAATKLPSQQQQQRQTIPSVKTELRVIIEIQGSKSRHKSEILSNSALTSDGKLNKSTQVNTSKQVAATPKEILEKLKSIGKEHSMDYTRPTGDGAAGHKWLEVSKSSVRNEMETDTRKKSAQDGDEADDEGTIIITSDATIKHRGADNKSAIDLNSRALKRYEARERDPHTGLRTLRTGRMVERTLVESEAGFDDNDLPEVETIQEREKQGSEGRKRVVSAVKAQTSKPTVVVSESKTPTPVPPTQLPATNRPQPLPYLAAPVSVSQQRSQANLHSNWPSAASSARSTPNLAQQATLEPPTRSRPTPVQPTKQFEQHFASFEEESENRRQITRNGQLVFDDRLRRYERQSSGTPTSMSRRSAVSSPTLMSPAPASYSSNINGRSLATPGGGGILRNSANNNPTGQVDKNQRPVIVGQQQQLLTNDQTSNLGSSSPETMDSGFAQSGAGSSSVLNQRRVASPLMQPQRPAARVPAPKQQQVKQANAVAASRVQGRADGKASGVLADDDNSQSSLTFVDDDDELIDQLGGSRMLSPPPTRAQGRRSPAPPRGNSRQRPEARKRGEYF